MAATVVQAIFGSYDIRIAKQWRDEDLVHRDQEVQWLNDDVVRKQQWRNADIERSLRCEKLRSEHRIIDARAEQLSVSSEQSALLCGFTIASMSNLGIPNDLSSYILFFFGVVSTIVCVTLLMCMVICTMLLLAVTRYASHTLDEELKKIPIIHIETESPFRTWWLKKCEQELTKAYKFMSIGVGFFLIDLGVLSWIQYISSTYTSSIISVLALIGFLFWQLRIASRWRYLLHPPSNTPMLANTMYTTTLMTTEQTTTWLNEAAAAAAIEFTQAQNGPQLRRLSIVTTSPQLSPSESKTEYR